LLFRVVASSFLWHAGFTLDGKLPDCGAPFTGPAPVKVGVADSPAVDLCYLAGVQVSFNAPSLTSTSCAARNASSPAGIPQ
jgi:hypothetical protein